MGEMRELMQDREGKSILESKIFISIVLIVLFKPAYFNEIGILDKAYNVACVAILIIFLFIIFYLNITSKIIWLILYYSILLISTSLNDGNLIAFMRADVYAFALCLVFAVYGDIALAKLVDAFNVIHIYVYANFITVLLFPNGLYKTELYTQNWLLGYKNPMVRLLIPILCISFINSIVKYGKITLYNYLLLMVIAVTAIKVKTVNGMIGVMMWTFLGVIAYYAPQIFRVINEKTMLIAYLIFVMVLFFVYIPSFVFDLLRLFGRENSFLVRYRLWRIIIKQIKDKPLLGYGYLQGDEFVEFSHVIWATHAHNWILNILMIGGVALLFIFLYGYICASKTLSKYRYEKISILIAITIMCFLIMGIDEAMTNSVFIYPIFILGMDLEKLILKNNKRLIIIVN